MGKAKKGKKANADFVYAKKAADKVNPFAAAKPATSKKLNPFEVHINREKFHILGRTCKHDKGLPGVSRAKAIKKRKETLGREYQVKHKTNQFHDRRIGKHLSGDQLDEEVLNARFVADKMSQMKQNKASRFNLNDDEVLTHRGQTLEEIEQFRDDRSDDDDADNEGLDADFTEVAHFGGEEGDNKDRKTAIDEMILEQKKRKAEIAKEKDEVNELTDKLDVEYKEVMGLLNKASKTELNTKKVTDDYDKALREMIFEPRGVVTDKLLSEEELAKREKDRLQKLENERLKRMQADNENVAGKKPTHRSADALDDGYFANEDDEEDGTLAYTLDGELGTQIDDEFNTGDIHVGKKDVDSNAEATDNEDEEDSNDEVEEDSNDEVGEDSNEEDVEDSNEEDEKENESDEDSDNLSDLKETDTEEESENPQTTKNQAKKVKVAENGVKSKPNLVADLPFTLDMPNTYKAFIALISNRKAAEQATIIERLIKCNHPKIIGVNRENVVKLFAFLLQYINEIFADASQDDIAAQFEILDKLNPCLYDLVHLNPEKMSVMLFKVIKEKYDEFRKNSKIFPGLETAIFLKLVSNFYSTSDFQHSIVTPCYIIIQHILSKARVRTCQDVSIGLFLVTIALEFSQQSKRFLPAVFNYLLGILYLSIPKRSVEVFKILPPFQNSGPMSIILAIPTDLVHENIIEEMMLSVDLVTTTFSTEFKIRALNTTFKLIADTISNVGETIGTNYIAEGFLEMLERLPIKSYPSFVQKNYESALEALKIVAEKTLTKLVPPEKRPKTLRFLEPRIEPVYDDKRRPKLSKEKEERAKLLHKLKRETKGAIREIRRDTEFIQKMRIQQQIQSDKERHEKVKRIYQEASVQQSELNELSRAKKKKKF